MYVCIVSFFLFFSVNRGEFYSLRTVVDISIHTLLSWKNSVVHTDHIFVFGVLYNSLLVLIHTYSTLFLFFFLVVGYCTGLLLLLLLLLFPFLVYAFMFFF